MQSYIFLGPPASGKGTQAKILAEELGLTYFGTGDLMRQEVKKRTHFGQIFQSVWTAGKGGLVDDETVLQFVKNKLDEMDQSHGFVFDGFPRTLDQAKFLKKELNQDIWVLNVKVSDETIVERSTTRRVCENCEKIYFQPAPNKKRCDACGGELIHRIEDTPEIVQKRLDVYNRLTQPLIDYYNQENRLINIDGEPNIEEVTLEIIAKINEQRKNKNYN